MLLIYNTIATDGPARLFGLKYHAIDTIEYGNATPKVLNWLAI